MQLAFIWSACALCDFGGVGGCSTWTWMSSCRRMACRARVWAARTSVVRHSAGARASRSACPRRSPSASAPPRPPTVWVQTLSTRRSRPLIPVSYTTHSWPWYYFHVHKYLIYHNRIFLHLYHSSSTGYAFSKGFRSVSNTVNAT